MGSLSRQLIAVFMVILTGILTAQEVVKLEYFFDKDGEVTIENLEEIAVFQPSKVKEIINIGFNHYASVWCRIRIYNADSEIGIYRIVTNNPHLDFVTLYDGDAILLAGDRVGSNPNNLLTASFLVHVEPGEEKEFILQSEKHLSYMAFSLDVLPEFDFQKRFLSLLKKNSLFLGFFTTFLLLNILLAISSARLVHFFYILHLVGGVLYVIINTGFFKYALTPSFLYVSELRLFLSIVNPVVFAVFIMQFLNTKQKLRIVYTLTNLLAFATLSLVPLFTLFFFADNISGLLSLFVINSFLTGLLILMVFITSILSYRYERRKSVYVLSAFAMIFIFVFLLILEYYAIIDIDISLEYILFPGIYEVLLFGVFLGVEYYRTFQINLKLQEKLLKKKDAELQAFSKGRIRERKHIASVLHDQMSSQLLAASMLMRNNKKRQALLNLKKLGDDIRLLSHSLMPMALEQGLLIEALQLQLKLLTEAFPEKTIELYNFGVPEKIDYPWIFDVYLVILEAIQNAIKHSKSNSIIMECYDHESTYDFQVVDDGTGFDHQIKPNGFGLSHSRQIVEGYNGTFEIDSGPGSGTTVMVSMGK